ncbi:MAG: type IV pilus assembly protein PilM [Snodgrassella sp.]|nr:type IV pilus assembly protein PilM [Snodgrassella sp.]
MKVKKFKTNSKNKKVVTTSSRQSLGINFTEKSINMVLLSASSLNQFRLEKYVVVPLPKNIIDNGNIEDHNEIVALLQQAKDKLQTHCKNVTVCIPQKLASIQFLTRDPDIEYTEEEQVLMELNQYKSLDETSYDYQPIMTDDDGNEHLLLVSSKREDVNLFLDIFADAEITPTQMDVDLIAIMNSAIACISIKYPQLIDKCVAVFNIDFNETQAIVMRDGIMLYKQEISIGYEHLLQSIRRCYQLTEEEAWDMLFDNSKPQDYAKVVFQPFQQQFTQEVQRVLQFYFTSASQENDIEEIMIFGIQENHANEFAQNVRQQTNISTQLINPLLLAQTDNHINDGELLQLSSLMTVAFGLALRGI